MFLFGGQGSFRCILQGLSFRMLRMYNKPSLDLDPSGSLHEVAAAKIEGRSYELCRMQAYEDAASFLGKCHEELLPAHKRRILSVRHACDRRNNDIQILVLSHDADRAAAGIHLKTQVGHVLISQLFS